MFMQTAAAPPQPQFQTMQVVVPPGVAPGGTFNAQTPHGLVSVAVPQGAPVQANGQIVMQIQVPVKQQVVVQQPVVQQQMVVQQPQVQYPQQVQQVAPQVQYPQQAQQVAPQVQYPQQQQPMPVPVQQGMPANPVQQMLQQVQLHMQPLTPAPQPQVMQQQQSATPAEKKTPDHVVAKKGKPGELVYNLNLSPSGPELCGEACCDRGASPVGKLQTSGKMPVELSSKTGISASAWELILEKLVAHQGQIPCYPMPWCQTYCAVSCGCCCACAVCLICAHATRDSWEAKVSAEVNEMLKKFGLCMHFEKEGPFNQVHAKFVWL